MPPRSIKVAIADGILGQLIDLPKPVAKKVSAWIEKFQENPAATGLNFERIQRAKDAKLRSVRVDRDYRAIVAAPERGDVYLLVHVDKHEDAYRWAEHARVEVHPETGELQVYRTRVDREPSPLAPDDDRSTKLFDAVRDRDLVRLGVPEALLPDVRGLASETELLERVGVYPKLAWDALAGLFEGRSVDEVYSEQGRATRAVDTDDFVAALENAETKSSFFIATDDDELRKVLAQPLDRWRIFLHPAQRRLVERHWNGPVRVLGGAGTGKTVVAMHRARWLADNVGMRDGGKVLVTTFTQNLAGDIRSNLETLCNPTQFARVEVAHLHGWAADYLRRTGVSFETIYDEDRLAEAWRLAMAEAQPALDLDIRFYRAEWSEIVVSNGIREESAYLRVARTGRGVALNRAQRKLVWPVFAAFRRELDRRGWKDGDDALMHVAEILEKEGAGRAPYRCVVVDETQDLSVPALRLVRALATPAADDLFLVGDGHQRIYRRRIALGQVGIDIRGRGRRLRINYRTTEEIRRFALSVLEGVPIDDLDGGAEERGADTSLQHGAAPTIHSFESADAEVKAVAVHIGALLDSGSPDSGICVTVRTNREADAIEESLGRLGLYVHKLSRRSADDRRRPGVRVATMHRVKGLEFDHIIVLGASADGIPNKQALAADDDLSRREAEWRERALLYVAATRARRTVWVSAVGTLTDFLNKN